MNSLYLEDHSSAYSFPAQRRDALWSSSATSSQTYDSQSLVYNLGLFDDESSNEVAIKLEQSYFDSESSYSESISYQIPYGCALHDIHSSNYPIKPDPVAAYPLPLINTESTEFAINVEFNSPQYDLTPPSPSEEEKSRFESRSNPDSDVSHEFSTSLETEKKHEDEVKPIEAYPRRKIVPRTQDSLRDFNSSLERQNRFPSQVKRPDKRDKLYKSTVGYRLKYLLEQLDARREINCIAHVVAQLKQDFPQWADEFKSDMVTKAFRGKTFTEYTGRPLIEKGVNRMPPSPAKAWKKRTKEIDAKILELFKSHSTAEIVEKLNVSRASVLRAIQNATKRDAFNIQL